MTPRFQLASIIVLPVLFLVSIVYQRPLMISPLNIYDEGIIAYGAARVMEGQLPYRDFWTQYAPGQFYAIAGLFKLLGKQIMVERWWDVVVRAALALSMGVLAARLTSRIYGLLVWGGGVLWVTYYGFFGYPTFQGLLFGLLSFTAFTQVFVIMASDSARSPNRWFFLSGLLLGIAALFRHDMGIYVGAAQSIVIFGHVFTQSTLRTPGQKIYVAIKIWLMLAGGAALVTVPAIAYFLFQMPFGVLLDQLFIFPLTVFPKVRHIPYPDFEMQLSALPYYAPFLVYALAAIIAVIDLRRGGQRDKALAWGVLTLVLFGLLGWNQARVRSDLIHTVQFLLPAIILLPTLYRAGARRLKLLSAAAPVIAAMLAVALSIHPISQYLRLREAANSEDMQRALGVALPLAEGTIMNSDQVFTAQTIQGLTHPGEYVYVGLKSHSRVFVNDVMFYFVMDRPSPTRYHELHPGLTNTAAIQEEMIADLTRHQVRYIVLTNMFDGVQESNESAIDSGVKLLDNYIRSNYEVAYTSRSYRILKLKQ